MDAENEWIIHHQLYMQFSQVGMKLGFSFIFSLPRNFQLDIFEWMLGSTRETFLWMCPFKFDLIPRCRIFYFWLSSGDWIHGFNSSITGFSSTAWFSGGNNWSSFHLNETSFQFSFCSTTSLHLFNRIWNEFEWWIFHFKVRDGVLVWITTCPACCVMLLVFK